MEDQSLLNTSSPSSLTESSINDELITATAAGDQDLGNAFASVMQKQLNEVKLQFSQLQKDFKNLQAGTITIKEHEAKIVELTKSFDSKIVALREEIAADVKKQLSGMTEIANSEKADKAKTEDLQKSIDALKSQTDGCNAKISEMFLARENDKAEIAAKVNQLNSTNADLNAKVCKFGEKVKTNAHQMQCQIFALYEGKKKFEENLSKIFFCRADDVVVDGRIDDYDRLDGNVLVVKKLEQRDDGNWYADGIEISFDEHPNFKVFVQSELSIKSDLSTVLNRVYYSNLARLCLQDSADAVADLKKLFTSCDIIHRFSTSKINDENGMAVDDIQVKMWKTIWDKMLNRSTLTRIIFEYGAKLPHINLFDLKNIKEGFDLKAFGSFIKNNPQANFELEVTSSDEFYAQIKRDEEELRADLPETCQLVVSRQAL